jgi:hypothetical protein
MSPPSLRLWRRRFSTRSCSTCSTALAGKPTIARVPIGAFALASQLVGSGACGILAPMIDSGEDARRLVEPVKFPPLGQRSWGPHAALPLSGPDAPVPTRAYARTIGLRIHISRRDGASELLWRPEPEVRLTIFARAKFGSRDGVDGARAASGLMGSRAKMVVVRAPV